MRRRAYHFVPDNKVKDDGLLCLCLRLSWSSEDRAEMIRPVVPYLFQQDFLYHYHMSLIGGPQGIGRTYQRIRSNFQWRGLYRSV